MFGFTSSRQKSRSLVGCTCDQCRATRRAHMPTPGQAVLFVLVSLPAFWAFAAGAMALGGQ